jgi:hypothetical protein
MAALSDPSLDDLNRASFKAGARGRRDRDASRRAILKSRPTLNPETKPPKRTKPPSVAVTPAKHGA